MKKLLEILISALVVVLFTLLAISIKSGYDEHQMREQEIKGNMTIKGE